MNINKKIILDKSNQYLQLENEILELLQKEVLFLCDKYKISFLIVYKEYDKKRTVNFVSSIKSFYRLTDANNQIIEILNKIPVQIIHRLKEIKQLIIK
jgi:thymidylate kinase